MAKDNRNWRWRGTACRDWSAQSAIDQYRRNTNSSYIATTPIGTRLCGRCKNRKSIKGGSIGIGGSSFICSDCKSPQP